MFKGNVAIVTGAGRGIGLAIARKLAENGAHLVIADMANQEEAAAEIQKMGVQALPLAVDVSNETAVNDMVKKAVDAYGKIDILVNNAGITRDGLIMRMGADLWDLVLNINLRGVFLCSKAVVRHMMSARSGKIVNIASVVGIMGNAGQVNYAASKAGVIGFTKSLAREVGSRNIQVNAVAPGFIQTPMTDKLTEEQKKNITQNLPLSRFGTPEDVANAVTFLCSPAASYITGHVLCVDGGMAM
jgi:3-oxoacyl-[acyl-carrier protein] reductase